MCTASITDPVREKRAIQDEAVLAELNKAQARTTLLAETAGHLLLSSEPRHVITALCAKVMAFLGCDLFLNFLKLEEGADRLKLNACAGIAEASIRDVLSLDASNTLSDGHFDYTTRTVLADLSKNGNETAAWLRALGLETYACYPLKVRARVLGAVAFGSRTKTQFQQGDLDLIQAVADLVAIALERQRWEAELQIINAELEARVRERTQSLQEMTEQLNSFCHSVAHDLRSPLRTQIGFARILIDDFAIQLGAEGTRYANLVLQAAERQSNILQDLLAHVSLSRAEMPLEPVLLADAVARVRADLSLETKQKEALIQDAQIDRQTVIANASSLHLVILNLLTNACKFVPAGRRPEIRLWTEQRFDAEMPAAEASEATKARNTIRLWIQDNGIGIAPQDQCRLFRMFQRLNRPSEYVGTGMGLAIVKKAVERMGGRVGAESEPGRGSRFWVELPAAN